MSIDLFNFRFLNVTAYIFVYFPKLLKIKNHLVNHIRALNQIKAFISLFWKSDDKDMSRNILLIVLVCKILQTSDVHVTKYRRYLDET